MVTNLSCVEIARGYSKQKTIMKITRTKFLFIFYLLNILPSLAQPNAFLGKVQQLDSIMNIAIDQQNYEDAINLSDDLLSFIEEVKGTVDSNYADGLLSKAYCLTKIGAFEEATPLYDKALDVYEKTIGMDNRTYVVSLYKKAEHLAYKGKLEKSKQVCEEVLSRAKGVLNNISDTAEELERILNERFTEANVNAIENAALFSAKKNSSK